MATTWEGQKKVSTCWHASNISTILFMVSEISHDLFLVFKLLTIIMFGGGFYDMMDPFGMSGRGMFYDGDGDVDRRGFAPVSKSALRNQDNVRVLSQFYLDFTR
jgi:hypothetical protein